MQLHKYNVLCLFRDQFDHVKPVESALQDQCVFHYDGTWSTDVIDGLRPDLIIGVNEHHPEIAECYTHARAQNIPTLTLQDGILEWRHMFENPLYNGKTGARLHFPVLADKLACIGVSSASVIRSFGNFEKIELTGMPKLDKIASNTSPTFQVNGNRDKNILILTSSKPWFNSEQKEVVIRALTDLKNLLVHLGVGITWRVTKEIPEILQIKNTFKNKSTVELSEAIQASDAVITTISTTILESQLLGKPTAILDYFNTPNFVNARWAIRSSDQIQPVVENLLSPTALDKLIQDSLLTLNLFRSTNSSAAKEVARLILNMIEFRHKFPSSKMPADMLHRLPFFDSAKTPARNLVFAEDARETIANLDLLQETLLRYKLENTKLKEQLKNQGFLHLLSKAIKKLNTK